MYFEHLLKRAILWFHGVMVSTPDSESGDPSSSLGGTCLVTLTTENWKRDIVSERDVSVYVLERSLKGLTTLLTQFDGHDASQVDFNVLIWVLIYVSVNFLTWSCLFNTSDGTRTHNPRLRRPMPYPLGYRGMFRFDVHQKKSILLQKEIPSDVTIEYLPNCMMYNK